MIADANGLLVTLELYPSFNRIRFYAATFVVSVLVCYGIGWLIGGLISDYFLLSLGLMLLPVFFGVLWLAKWVKRITDLGTKAIFSDMLIDIEKQALNI